MTLQDFVLGLVGVGGGGLSYAVANYLFAEFVPETWTPQLKRLSVFLITIILGITGLGLGQYLGYVEVTPDTIFVAAVTAFTTSQALHGAFELGKA